MYTSFESIPEELFKHAIFPHLSDINIVKTCKRLWALRFIARRVLIERSLSLRGLDIRRSLYSKLGDVRNRSLVVSPDRFDRDILETASEIVEPTYFGFSRIVSVLNDRTRRDGVHPCVMPEQWFFRDDTIVGTTTLANASVSCSIRRDADVIDEIAFDRPVRDLTISVHNGPNVNRYNFGETSELAFTPFLPICSIPFTAVTFEFTTIEENTIVTVRKRLFSNNFRISLMCSNSDVQVVARNGNRALVRCCQGAGFFPSIAEPSNEVM